MVIGAGLLGFGTKIAQQVNETGDTIGGWFGSGEDVFGAGSADQAETAFAVYYNSSFIGGSVFIQFIPNIKKLNI